MTKSLLFYDQIIFFLMWCILRLSRVNICSDDFFFFFFCFSISRGGPRPLGPPPPLDTRLLCVVVYKQLWHDILFCALYTRAYTTSSQKILPPPPHTKKISIRQKISNPSQNISTSPKCFFVYSSPVFVLESACLVEFIYKK